MESALTYNIKKIINEQGMKQKAVAARAGFDETDFCNMLNGRKLLRAEAIRPICNALGVTPNELFQFDERGA